MRTDGGHSANQSVSDQPQTYSIGIATPAIANEINLATRDLHNQLNKLIIARLPLALPPFSTDTLPYTLGLQAFASIFIAFEAAWDCYSTSRNSNTSYDDELHVALAALLPADVRRTTPLQKDLQHLRVPVDTAPEARNAVKSMSSLTNQIHASIMSKPHLIVAHTWIMYMALFSGGRYIRAQLRSAGESFWPRGSPQQGNKDIDGGGKELGYTFLEFSGEQDGEDIKASFKRQLAEVDGLLSLQQRREIVAESREIFARCVDLVMQLDVVCGTPVQMLGKEQGEQDQNKSTHTPALVGNLARSLRTRAKALSSQGRNTSLLLSALVCVVTLFLTTSGLGVKALLLLSLPAEPA